MLQKVIIFLAAFCILQSALTQNADCSSMFKLTKRVYNSKPITGFGNVREFEGYGENNEKFFEQEENSIWYLITMPDSGMFTFDIKTHNKEDDWDFMLFEHKIMFCKRIADKKIEPIRSNLSRSPFTGLKEGAEHEFMGAGINYNYSKPVIANKGDEFVLVVNNPKESGKKHTLILHFPEPKKVEVVEEKQEKADPNITHFKLTIKDITTKEPIKSSLIIAGLTKKTTVVEDAAEYETDMAKRNRDVDVSISAEGYMLLSKQFQISKTRSTFEKVVYLEKIKTGQKVNLKNIQFQGNRADFLNTARAPLKALLRFMEVNPNVKIEVEGHVNGPKQKNTKDYKQLSFNRAYAVKDYLMKNGIEKDRIDFVGYGNSQMLYPLPKSAYQESANRRVEIKIISNDFGAGDRNFH